MASRLTLKSVPCRALGDGASFSKWGPAKRGLRVLQRPCAPHTSAWSRDRWGSVRPGPSGPTGGRACDVQTRVSCTCPLCLSQGLTLIWVIFPLIITSNYNIH